MIILQAHGRRLPSVLLLVIRQDCYAKPVARTQPSSPDSRTESTAEPSSLEQAMIPQQALMKDALSPHTPSPLPAPSAVVSAAPPCAAQNSISAFVAPKTENLVPGGGLCPLRRIRARRPTRQDAQIN